MHLKIHLHFTSHISLLISLINLSEISHISPKGEYCGTICWFDFKVLNSVSLKTFW